MSCSTSSVEDYSHASLLRYLHCIITYTSYANPAGLNEGRVYKELLNEWLAVGAFTLVFGESSQHNDYEVFYCL